jgi:hypothetical protein
MGHRQKEPHVGIFWFVSGKLLIDSARLSEAESYGDHLIHARSHLEVWTLFQQSSIAPGDMEYEEAPRGRVMYDTKTGRFTVLADTCILQDQNLVMKLMSEMNLPEETATDTHSHYRCAACLRSGLD